MEEKRKSLATQLIDREGVFNVRGLESFIGRTKFAERGTSYVVVAIAGAQSSGKSTLLNHLFGTDFQVMDAISGRSKTTEGIWISSCSKMDPFTIVMDLEGADGKERGEDDTAFEKQSTLFALASASIVIINMWCHDVGREHAGNRPLLKTVFQFMMRMFAPRKTTLLFVLRDKTKTPLGRLEAQLKNDIEQIWDEVAKPSPGSSLISDFFNV